MSTPASPPRLFVVDDDAEVAELVSEVMRDAGFAVTHFEDGEVAWPAILENPPDVVLLDLMMPGLDGFGLARRIRAEPRLGETRLVVLSGKVYDADRQAAMAAGADAFFCKPFRPSELAQVLRRVVNEDLEVRFWGVRGTLPVPSPENVRYGGNTSCVSLSLPRDRLFVFDAGTGIRALGENLLQTRGRRVSGSIFITHPHWDHINALPFFAPLYVQGSQFEILGPGQPGFTMRDMVAAQMDGRFFPITPRELGADVHYRDLRHGRHSVQGLDVDAFMLMHPGVCLGYRVYYKNRSFAYVTDQELYLPGSPFYTVEYIERMVRFLSGADVVVMDATYTDAEYPSRTGWGHSAISEVVRVADAAGVGRLCLFHHDPSQTDRDIDAKLEAARELAARLNGGVEVLAPAEGDTLRV
jgi:CheY-like chemotaxis protein/phosphoribosyl 1,2-cyclic phosphodiesterase